MSTVDLSSRLSLDVQSLDGLKRTAKEDPQAALKGVASQFEAIMTGMLFKQMRQASLADDSLMGSEGKMYTEMLDEQLAQKISQAHGLGLADLMVKQLSPQVPGQATVPVKAVQPAEVARAYTAAH